MIAEATAQVKAQYRAELLAARSAVPGPVHDAEAARLCDHLPGVVTGGGVVCAYLPVGAEPGSEAMVARLAEICDTVLLPVVAAQHRALLWGRYRPGALVPGRFGLREPPVPWLPPEEVGRAAVVLVPALAVDRAGVRLGRGGGYYDRSLALCDPRARLVAVVRDCEVVEELPHERHDVPVTHALTPSAGLVRLRE